MMNVTEKTGSGSSADVDEHFCDIIEQKQGQVNFHGDLQHEDREITDDINSSKWRGSEYRELIDFCEKTS